MKDLWLAKEEGSSIKRKVKNISTELLKIMACSENSEKFNAIFKKKNLHYLTSRLLMVLQ